MEEKYNEATPQRPEGERILDASLVTMDLDQFIAQVKKEPTWQESDRNSITIFKSSNMRIVLIGLHEGAKLKTHTTSAFISVQMIAGKIDFEVKSGVETLTNRQLLALHPDIPHSIVAKEESFLLLTLAMEPGEPGEERIY